MTSVSSAEWLHHMDPKEMLGEKARRELHKDAAGCFEQILDVATH